jgi:archaellum biogenesis protein FlaJ (TadC family)
MYETSNENITILNEVYVSLLIAIIFVMSLGIVLPFIMGAESMNTFVVFAYNVRRDVALSPKIHGSPR